MVRILITGGNGLLGTKLIERLLLGTVRSQGEPEHLPISLSQRPCSNRFLGEFPFYQVDAADPAALSAAFEAAQPDAVIHTAAMTDVDGCERQRDLAWRNNVSSTQALGDLCASYGVRVVYLSTEYVFDGQAGPYRESDKTHPISYYGQTKLAGEEAIAARCRDWAVGRTTVVYGYARNVRPNFVLWLVQSLKAGTPVKVVADQTGSPTFADNLADQILALLHSGKQGIFNTAGADVIGRYNFAREVAAVFGLNERLIEPVATASLRQAAPRPLQAGLLMDRFRTEIGAPILGVREGLAVLRQQLEEI